MIANAFRTARNRFRPSQRLSDAWIFAIRLIGIGCITTGIYWGATGFRIYLNETNIWWYHVDQDLQLALLGFFNKMLDVLLVSSLEYTASILITTWMTAERTIGKERGATFGDFDLKNELTKPWMTVWSFIWRCRRFRWSWKSFFRFLLCLCVSICVLLQGLAVNTIAMPKSRWYPNVPMKENGFSMTKEVRKGMTVTYPKALLQEVNWGMHMKAGHDNIGIEGALEWALALSASRSFDGLSDIVPESGRPEKGWQCVHARDLGGTNRWTALNTNVDKTKPVETLSIINKQVRDVYDWLKETGHGLTTASTGWTGNLTLSVPVLNTVCHFNDATGTAEGAMTVIPPNAQSPNNASFTIKFGPTSTQPKGIDCTITFRQALHSFAMWIVDLKPVDISMNHYFKTYDSILNYENPLPQDHAIANALASQTQGVLTAMNRITPDQSIARYLLLISRQLQKVHPSITSDAQGLSVVIGVLLQNLISYSDQIRLEMPKTMPTNPSDTITSFPIQWQLYGSGPRLAWQWITVFVLVTVLCCFCFGLWQTIWYWMGPGEWTEVPGMMVLAQISGDLKIETGTPEGDKRLYYVAEESKGRVLLGCEGCKKAK